jgi:hypothetical protein
LLDRLEAENRELRNQAIQLALQIQMLRRIGKSARGRAPSASPETRAVGIPTATSRRRPARSP